MTKVKKIAASQQAVLMNSQPKVSHKGWISGKEVKKLIKIHSESTLDRVLTACENAWKLSDTHALKKKELFDLVFYIETKLKSEVQKGHIYLKKDKTDLVRTIEYDPTTKRTFIHLKTHRLDRVGKGWHKVVTYSILYHAKKPEIVVNSVGDKTVHHEAKILGKINNNNGFVKTYAMTEHIKKKTNEKVYSLIQKHYNAGSLRSYQKGKRHMTKKETITCVRDLFLGLEKLHKKRLAHLDLHSGNILCNRSVDPKTGKTTFSSALIDFGQVRTFDEAKKRVPQVEVPRRLAAPEALLKKKHRVDVRKIEVYALGCNLYHLYFQKFPEWTDKKKFYEMKHMSQYEKTRFSKHLTDQITSTMHKRKKELSSKNKTWNQLGKLIIQMCDPDPKKRASAESYRKSADKLLRQLG